MSEEKWIEDALNSLEDAKRAKAPEGVFNGIKSKINQKQQKPTHQWMAVAAIILLVLCSNVILVNNYLAQDELVDNQEDYPQMISDYTLYENE